MNKKSAQTTWRKMVTPYQNPSTPRSLWEIGNTIIPYFILLYLMWLSLSVSYWLTLLLAIPAAGFMVRVFIIFHDCTHGSFFKSQKANMVVGYITGILTFTPYEQWRHDHAVHHATAGDLDRRGIGDVPTMTTQEFLAAPRWKRVGYRLLRHPLVLFGIGPLYLFLLNHRFWNSWSGKREKVSVVITDLALLVLITLACWAIGWEKYLLIQLPVVWIGGALGEWMFYVQHQFPGVYWARHAEWDYYRSAVEGASYYQLPGWLQWFTGNIGFHHIHHLNPRIPNYLLERCHRENPTFQQVKFLTLGSSLKCLTLNLWDEEKRQLISFSQLKRFGKTPSGA
jgi:acyl-lipid omega-6 desaturase (Delta-12 desaturase)